MSEKEEKDRLNAHGIFNRAFLGGDEDGSEINLLGYKDCSLKTLHFLAETGNAAAQMALASFLWSNREAESFNEKQALSLFGKAAMAGNPRAQLILLTHLSQELQRKGFEVGEAVQALLLDRDKQAKSIYARTEKAPKPAEPLKEGPVRPKQIALPAGGEKSAGTRTQVNKP